MTSTLDESAVLESLLERSNIVSPTDNASKISIETDSAESMNSSMDHSLADLSLILGISESEIELARDEAYAAESLRKADFCQVHTSTPPAQNSGHTERDTCLDSQLAAQLQLLIDNDTNSDRYDADMYVCPLC